MTKTATIADFGSHLAEYLADVQRGDEVLFVQVLLIRFQIIPEFLLWEAVELMVA